LQSATTWIKKSRIMKRRSDFSSVHRVVVKIGSSLLTDGGRGLSRCAMSTWVEQMAGLRKRGIEVLLVSSGSVAEGMCRLGWKSRPKALHRLQAAASVGQMGLVEAYESNFKTHGLQTAQVLLTHEDLSDRRRYLNARSALLTLLGFGVVPVINENDTVATDEIRFGDNDTLAALVANLVEADLMIILTDQLGLFDRDPSFDADAKLVSQIEITDPSLVGMAGGSLSGFGRGGMMTKITAAALSARSGAATVIASGSTPNVLSSIIAGDEVGSFLVPDAEPLVARKRWLAGQLQVKGKLVVDQGAVNVLQDSGRSLLPVGVVGVEGCFSRGELVACVDVDGREIARGLANYGAQDAAKIKRHPSGAIESILGYVDEPEIIHRDNLILI